MHNAGAMVADEVVQVYLEPPGRAVERPVRSLIGFQRLTLEPEQSERLRLLIPLRRLAYFDEAHDGFALEAGRHRLVAARHVEDPGLAVDLELEPLLLGP